MHTLTLCILIGAVPALADDGVELFVDKGETFIRAGSDAGLQRGAALPVVAKGGKRIGTATVLEVWPALSRVSLDEASRADKTPAKYVTLAAKAEAPPPAAPAQPVAPPPPTGLRGFAKYGWAGPWTVLQVFNENTYDWTDCTVTMMPMSSSYQMKFLQAGDHEMISRSNFSKRDFDGDPTSVKLKCTQGEGTIPVR